jgi:hypothetical protein
MQLFSGGNWHSCVGSNMQVYENHPEGVAMVRYKSKADGLKCIQIMNGRW